MEELIGGQKSKQTIKMSETEIITTNIEREIIKPSEENSQLCCHHDVNREESIEIIQQGHYNLEVKTETVKLTPQMGTIKPRKLKEISQMSREEYEEIILQEGDYNTQEEDNKLANWKKWLECRKRLHKYFKSQLKREPGSLIMNTEDVYEKQIKKQLIEYATTYIKFDKYRGDPKFWKDPIYLKDKLTQLPLTCSVANKFDRTKPDENKPPTLEYIAIPEVIKKEKGFIRTEKKSKKQNFTEESMSAHKCNYYENRKLDLQHNTNLIEGHRPDLRTLFISGERFDKRGSLHYRKSSKFETPIVPEIIIEQLEDKKDEIEFEEMNPILMINGNKIDKTMMKNQKHDIVFKMEFSNCKLKKLYKIIVCFENIGNIAIRYSWRKVEPYKNRELPLVYTAQLKQRFIFPTNSNIFLPGQIMKLQYLFKSRECGIYHEKWILDTDPVFSSDRKILIQLQASVQPGSIAEELNEIENHIKKHQAKTCAQQVVNEWIQMNRIKPCIPYKNLFTDKDIFLHNNPDHYYRHDQFSKLFNLYKKISGDEKWDYSIITLRGTIMNLKSFEEKSNYLKELYHVSRTLLKPTIEVNLTKEKYRCVYQLLCTLCNTIEKEADNLRLTYRLVYPLNVQLSQGSITDSESKQPLSKSATSLTKQRRSKQKSGSRKKISSNEILPSSHHSSRSSKLSIVHELEFEPGYERRKCQYLQTFTIKIYQQVIYTIDQITAIIESLNLINTNESILL